MANLSFYAQEIDDILGRADKATAATALTSADTLAGLGDGLYTATAEVASAISDSPVSVAFTLRVLADMYILILADGSDTYTGAPGSWHKSSSGEDTTARAAIAEHIADKSNPHEVTKEQIGLGNVDNTADINKPISTATQEALSNKVDKVTGKGLSTNDYTTAEKEKLAGIEAQANKTVVDDTLSDASTNPVQNKAVQAPVARLVDAGAKNALNLNTTFTAQSHRGITYINNHDGTILVDGTSNANDSYVTLYDMNTNDLFGFHIGETVVIVSTSDKISINLIPKKAGGDYGLTIYGYKSSPAVYTIPANFSGFILRVSVPVSGTSVDNVSVGGMICSPEDYAISPKIVPYAMSNAELTAAIQAIQAQLANQ